MNMDYLNLVETRFKKNFPKSHLIISYEKSVHYIQTTEEWSLYIVFDELSDEDLSPEKIYETFKTFKDLDNKLSWHCHRVMSYCEGIKKEVQNVSN